MRSNRKSRKLIFAVAFGLMSTCALASTPSVAQAADSPVDPAAVEMARKWEISLDEAIQRVSLQPNIEAAVDWLQREDVDRFAGAWIDQAHEGTTHFLATGFSSAEKISLREMIDSSVPIIYDLVPQSLGALEKIRPQMNALLPRGYGIVSHVSIRTNALHVVLWEDTPGLQTLIANLSKQFGRLAEFETQTQELGLIDDDYLLACSQPSPTVESYCDPPTRGGAGFGPVREGHDICTMGFNVRSDSDNLPYILTAGHCIKEYYGAGEPWVGTRVITIEDHINYYTVGDAFGYQYTSTQDSGLVHVAPNNFGAGRVFVAASTGGSAPTTRNEYYPIATTPGSNASLVGNYVCKSGRTGGTGCGYVFATNYTNPSGGHTGLIAVEFDKDPQSGQYLFGTCTGDSGGPVFVAGHGYGIAVEAISGGAGVRNGQPCFGRYAFRSLASALDERNVHLVAP